MGQYDVIVARMRQVQAMTIKLSFILLFAFVFFLTDASAQVVVELRLDTAARTNPGQGIFCDKDYNCGLLPSEDQKESTFGIDDVPMKVKRDGNDFLLTVDSDGRLGLRGEKPVRLSKDTGSIVKIRKHVTTRKYIYLPYEITHIFDNENGKEFDTLFMRAHYLLQGTFRDRGCRVNIALNDISAEGKFDITNGDRGTNLQIDRNKDGKFWGKGEFISTNEIVEICGRNYVVSALSYSRIVFQPTLLKLARVGEKTVDFSIDLLNGTNLSPASLKGRSFIFDFWASWCQPCVANLPHIKKLREELKGITDVFSINVDKSVRRSLAEQIIENNDLASFTSIRGKGEEDPVWKSFGGANQNHLAIPLYVLIDKNGIVRYSGNGGQDLAELRAIVEKVIRP